MILWQRVWHKINGMQLKTKICYASYENPVQNNKMKMSWFWLWNNHDMVKSFYTGKRTTDMSIAVQKMLITYAITSFLSIWCSACFCISSRINNGSRNSSVISLGDAVLSLNQLPAVSFDGNTCKATLSSIAVFDQC